MAIPTLPETPEIPALPSDTRQIQRVMALSPDCTYPLYPLPCQRCGVTAQVGVASSYLHLKHAEHDLLIFESGLLFSHSCPTCRLTTEAICTMLAALGHDHWQHAEAVGVVASHTLKNYEVGSPATCLHHAVLTLRCGECAWGEVHSVTERTTIRYRARSVDEGHATSTEASPEILRSAARRGRKPTAVAVPTYGGLRE